MELKVDHMIGEAPEGGRTKCQGSDLFAVGAALGLKADVSRIRRPTGFQSLLLLRAGPRLGIQSLGPSLSSSPEVAFTAQMLLEVVVPTTDDLADLYAQLLLNDTCLHSVNTCDSQYGDMTNCATGVSSMLVSLGRKSVSSQV